MIAFVCGAIFARRRNHLISCPNAEALEGDEEGIGTVAYTNTMFDPTKLGKSLFKSPDIGASNEGGCGNYLLNGRVDFIFDALILGLQVYQGNLHKSFFPRV